MARRISRSQLRSKISQARSRQRQAVRKLDQAVRRYNSKVRAYNSRVRANRDRLKRELTKLSRRTTSTRYINLRTSVDAVHRSYAVLEHYAESDAYSGSLDRFLDLSERETANAVSVMNALEGDTPENEAQGDPPESAIDQILVAISQDVADRWKGALFALNPQNPDAGRHFCTSARELLSELFERYAKDEEVKTALPNCELTQHGKPTRRTKILYFFHQHDISEEAIADFVEDDMDNVIQLFRVFNDGTHGSSGRFEHSQLLAIRARVESAVSFLWSIITGSAFSAA